MATIKHKEITMISIFQICISQKSVEFCKIQSHYVLRGIVILNVNAYENFEFLFSILYIHNT